MERERRARRRRRRRDGGRARGRVVVHHHTPPPTERIIVVEAPAPPPEVVVVEAPPPPPELVVVAAPTPPPEVVVVEAPAPLEPPPDDVAPAFVPGELPDDYPPPPELDPIPETPEVVVTPSSPAPTAVEAVVAVEVEVSVNPEPAVRPILGVGLAVLSPTGTPTTYTGLRAYGGLEWSRISLLGAVLLGPSELGDRLQALDVQARYHLVDGSVRPWLGAGAGMYSTLGSASSEGLSAGAKLGLGVDLGLDSFGVSLALGARQSSETATFDATGAVTWRF